MKVGAMDKNDLRVGHNSDKKCYGERACSVIEQARLFDNLIWGVDEVATFTSYAKGTIYNLVSRGKIPYRTRGRKSRLVFVPSEIVAWLKGEQT